MSSEVAIKVEGLGKCYQIYDTPRDRLKQFVLPPLRRLVGLPIKQYCREFWALKDVSFEVKKGEVVGVIGRNGAGKSTLLQLICGTTNQTEGVINVNGRVAALLELGSGFNPEFTGRENVYMNAKVLGLTHEEVNARLAEIEKFADIGDFMEQPVKSYSSGMYVRLAFAVAINVDPDILVVDEALAVGDIRFQIKCQRRINELRETGTTILLVSHSGADVVRLCSKAIWLDGGVVRGAGDAKVLVEEYHAFMTHDVGKRAAESTDRVVRADDSLAELVPIPAQAFITGEGGAALHSVGLFNESGRLVNVIDRPQEMSLVFEATTLTNILHPFFGFQVINSAGLRVLSSSNLLAGDETQPIMAGTKFRARFRFFMPEISNDKYLLAVGINDGNIESHVRHAYVYDAFVFDCIFNSPWQQQSGLYKLAMCHFEIHHAV
jgi:lipopolysaccharide transport system ATP-binding protein